MKFGIEALADGIQDRKTVCLERFGELPTGVFLARDFVIRDGDTVYVTEAPFVQWQKTIERMRDEGADMFLEVGPCSVLTKLVRRIDYSVNSVAISDEYEGLLTERGALVEAAAR